MSEQPRLQYWVVGGEYRDPNRFDTILGEERWLGPYKTKAEAMRVWKEWAWKTVDNAQIRYRVVRADKPKSGERGETSA